MLNDYPKYRSVKEREKWKVENLETCYAQRRSKVSESVMKNERRYAQRLSKVSESGAKKLDALEI